MKRNSDSNESAEPNPTASHRRENILWSSLPHYDRIHHSPLSSFVVHSPQIRPITFIWIQLAHNFIQISIQISYQSNLAFRIVSLFNFPPYQPKPYNFQNYTKITYTTIMLVVENKT